MTPEVRSWGGLVVALVLAAVVCGDEIPSLPPIVLSAPPSNLDDDWSLPRLEELAAQQHPDLAVAAAKSQAAYGKLIQAGLYPNPTLTAKLAELGHRGNGWGETGLGVGQEIVTARKRQWAQGAAAQGLEAADWQKTTRWYAVVTRVRLAYFEVLTARHEIEAQRRIVKIAEQGLAAAEKLFKAGAGNRPDILRARVERDQAEIGVAAAERRLEAAWRRLWAAAGVSPQPVRAIGDVFAAAPPAFAWPAVAEQTLSQSSEIQEAQARVLEAEQLVRLAQVNRRPNLNIAALPFYNHPDRDFRVDVHVVTKLPLFDRNQGNILSAHADLAGTQAELRRLELQLTDRLALAFQRYQTARQQAEAYAKRILPNARESLRLIQIGYDQGDPKYNYTALLQAQQLLFQAELANVRALGEQWQAVSELAGLVQMELRVD